MQSSHTRGSVRARNIIFLRSRGILVKLRLRDKAQRAYTVFVVMAAGRLHFESTSSTRVKKPQFILLFYFMFFFLQTFIYFFSVLFFYYLSFAICFVLLYSSACNDNRVIIVMLIVVVGRKSWIGFFLSLIHLILLWAMKFEVERKVERWLGAQKSTKVCVEGGENWRRKWGKHRVEYIPSGRIWKIEV